LSDLSAVVDFRRSPGKDHHFGKKVSSSITDDVPILKELTTTEDIKRQQQ
jgi:hypothetical protein